MKNKEINFMDMIPMKKETISWSSKNESIVTLKVNKKGGLEKLFRTIFKTPHSYTLDLDEQGSFVWKVIDGSNTVHDISKLLHIKFGKDADPLIERLITFLKILKNNDFIEYSKGGI